MNTGMFCSLCWNPHWRIWLSDNFDKWINIERGFETPDMPMTLSDFDMPVEPIVLFLTHYFKIEGVYQGYPPW